jgi:hypothetical protein
LRLFLHIGVEKTGSSFVQTSLARNRDVLFKNAICFPLAGHREKDMLSGRISPGNAQKLSRAVKKQDYKRIRIELLEAYNTGMQQNADILLLSNENLIEALSEKTNVKLFKKALSEIELDLASILIILRDPVDQALSLFKHRAKSGRVIQLSQWLKESYKYPNILKGFYESASAFDCEIVTRKYQKDGHQLLKIFYQDWLKIMPPQIREANHVNPSLTLSELALLGELAIYNDQIAIAYYKKMIEIDLKEKSKDEYLKEWAEQITAAELIQYEGVWKTCNEYLPQAEKLIIPEFYKESGGVPETYSFSREQLKNLAAFTSAQAKVGTIFDHILKRIRYRLGKIKGKLFVK